MWASRASASTSSGCAYSRSIRSRTRRSRARSRRCCAADDPPDAGLAAVAVLLWLPDAADKSSAVPRDPPHAAAGLGRRLGRSLRQAHAAADLLAVVSGQLELVDRVRRMGDSGGAQVGEA